eukprot:TRINITY_DN104112_c0_g1_i1.p1 TRINITY_DN104112_c0_g1~~TRINITY_DN104112_c0_g1_i1.p1  ORF type:complete len:153 (-),score=60.66 TRINITY_DN104112_c0_g1_i1:204-662(-)
MAAAGSADAMPREAAADRRDVEDVADEENPDRDDEDAAELDADGGEAEGALAMQLVPDLGPSALSQRIKTMQAARTAKRKEAAAATADLRNAKRRQSRLKTRAMRLDNNELLEVFKMRQETQAKAMAKGKAAAAAKGKAKAKAKGKAKAQAA